MEKRSRAGTRGSPADSSPRFTGKLGKHRLRERLRAQTLVAGDVTIASAVQQAGKLLTFAKGDTLIQQGAPENDLLMILHGEVQIYVNGRPVAVRQAGTHIGEMSLVDHLATRSASAMALSSTVVLVVPEHRFSAVAAKHPDLWRRVAVEVANRLRERNRFLRQPNSQPVLFIGSSSEGTNVVEAVYSNAARRPIVPRPWTDGVFQASSTTIESLIALTEEADFAALVLTPDDVTASRGQKKPSPRDNVVFELGLLIGALGRERVFILKPSHVDIRIPKDLLGVTWLEYRKGGPGPLRRKLAKPCAAIFRRIKEFGPR